uniref:Uncharacterized protein n=1 Tax=Knipowitschia caucasica TaxID=637954 RepID=A0AAV2ITQ5_KNICA
MVEMTGSVKQLLCGCVEADYGALQAAAAAVNAERAGAGSVGEKRVGRGWRQFLSQAINQRHSYCGTIIQSSLLHNSAQGSTGLAVSSLSQQTGRSRRRGKGGAHRNRSAALRRLK